MNEGAVANVLVVDDSVETRRRVCRLLAEVEGVELFSCGASPNEVLPRVRALKPGCVVVDVPVHDAAGFALLDRVRETNSDCTLVVISNHLTEQFRARGAQAGVAHFLSKATDFESLVDIVRGVRERL